MAAITALQQIQSTTTDPDIKAAATLLLAFPTIDAEFFFEGQQKVNTLLKEKGFIQNRNSNATNATIATGLNTRYAYVEALSALYTDMQGLLPVLETQYPPDVLLLILTKALEKLSTREGNKQFDNRAAKCLLFLKACMKYRSIFTDEQIKKILHTPHLFDVLMYDKDWRQTLRNMSISKHKNLVNSYISEKDGLLQFLLNIYAKEKKSSLNTAQANFAKVVSKLIREQSIDQDQFKNLLVHFLPADEVNAIFSHFATDEEFTDILLESCPISKVKSIECPSKKTLQVCPQSLAELDKDYIESYCASVGGRRKTRKQKKRSRRTRRR
jgi:hypothetical protein